jgi:tyrosyl-tRNA synthetase
VNEDWLKSWIASPQSLRPTTRMPALVDATTEAGRRVEGGGVRVDSVVVSDKGLKLEAGTYVVQVGKRKFARVKLS